MHTGKIEIATIDVPPGDRGEQLIGNLTLALFASELHAIETARTYLARAHELAAALAVQSPTYRPLQASKFVRLTCESGDETEIILLSMINDILVVPTISSARFATSPRVYPEAVNVKKLEVVYFMLRLRPRRLATVLESLRDQGASQQLTEAVRRILKACMFHQLPAGQPLDCASDCFALARDLIGKRNLPLAALALNNADRALNSFIKRSSTTDHSEIVRSMKSEIRSLLDELKQTAM